MSTNWSTEYQTVLENNDAKYSEKKEDPGKYIIKILIFVKQLTGCVHTCVKIYDYRESPGRKNTSYLHWLQWEVGVSIKIK